MEFTLDMLADGRAFRTLNIVDDFTRECVAIEVDRWLPGALVVRVLTRLADERRLPSAIVLDNGPNSAGVRSIPGRTPTASHCASSAQVSRLRAPTSRASAGTSATSASVNTGFAAWPRPRRPSRAGASTTTSCGPITPCSGRGPQPTPPRARSLPRGGRPARRRGRARSRARHDRPDSH
jgi:hypothetical protein